jgi:hypothetical protein
MIAPAFITSVTYTLVTIVLFVLVFAICLSITSKASNQELLAATAAYAAVLAVFVGNAPGQAPPTSHDDQGLEVYEPVFGASRCMNA